MYGFIQWYFSKINLPHFFVFLSQISYTPLFIKKKRLRTTQALIWNHIPEITFVAMLTRKDQLKMICVFSQQKTYYLDNVD